MTAKNKFLVISLENKLQCFKDIFNKMPPKRRDHRDGEGGVKNGRVATVEAIQNDHELFLQAFEKPTQIYRYLRTRNMISPIFLNRTLTYMKSRMSRSNKPRSTFKVDNMLQNKISKLKNDKINSQLLGDYMSIMFIGCYDKNLTEQQKSAVKVETMLLKLSHKKRKDSTASLMQASVGVSDVEINPSEVENNKSKIAVVNISADSFKPLGGPMNRSYILLLRVETYPGITTNGVISNTDIDGDEPAVKKFKPATKLYGSELVIFDKHGRCLLTEGDYVLALEEIIQTPKNMSPKKPANWETLPEMALDEMEKSFNPFDTFDKCPTLKFRLVWAKEPSPLLIETPLVLSTVKIEKNDIISSNKENQVDAQNSNNNNNKVAISVPAVTTTTSSITNNKEILSGNGEEKMQIVYQFIYNNNSRQQTEACADFHCPWCSINCIELYPLLKHLKLCHSRFNFVWAQIANGARIDVSINDSYDGSFSGSPYDLMGQSGYAFLRAGPVRRTEVSNLLVCRPRRTKPQLSEFAEIDEPETQNERPLITGHNRLYHHTVTCLPVNPRELEIDSEGESDPQWLQHKTMMMIDEFTDVNEGEKELMKMWNLHIMKYGYVGDCQLPLACDMFLDQRGKELLQKNLYRNFILHMCSLFDYGLIAPDAFYKTVRKLQKLLSENPVAQQIMTDTRSEQMNFWLKIGVFKQQTQLQQQREKQAAAAAAPTPASQTEPAPKNVKKESTPKKTDKTTEKNSTKQVTMSPNNPNKKFAGPAEPTNIIMRRKSSAQPPKFNGKLPTEPASAAIKRKILQLKDTPQRRRSAGPSLQQNDSSTKLGPKRRKSVAIVPPTSKETTTSGATNTRKRCF